jgi:hypothetical protein
MFQMILVGTVLLLLASIMSAVATTNTVAPSGLGDTSRSITTNDLKPPQCDALHLTNDASCED